MLISLCFRSMTDYELKSCCLVKPTLDVLQHLLLWDIDPSKSLANFSLPQRDQIVGRVDVGCGSNVHDLVEGSWIIYGSDGVRPNVFFLVVNHFTKQNRHRMNRVNDQTKSFSPIKLVMNDASCSSQLFVTCLCVCTSFVY